MTVYDFKSLVNFVRRQSPFYRELYKNVKESPSLEELPILDGNLFWRSEVLTGSHVDGIIFKSGGTSGRPKYSYFTQEEWETFTTAFGKGMVSGGLKSGDAVANLFYAGDLYASFLFIMKSLENSGLPLVHFPMSGGGIPDTILKTLKEFDIPIWAGVPTTLLRLADLSLPYELKIKKILFGGESLYSDQQNHLSKIFPGVEIRSIGYASVDAGLLGYADPTCGPQEHRVFSDYTILEIVDEETLEPIEESFRPGKILLTNLTRKLMPIIRYPVGDRGEWVEPPQRYRKFQILGRSEEGARIGPATIYYEDLRSILESHHDDFQVQTFQFILKHFEQKDQLEIKIAAHLKNEMTRGVAATVLEKDLLRKRPMLQELMTQKMIHPLKISFVSLQDIQSHPRTGKAKRVIDERV